MNTSTGPGTKIAKYSSFVADIALKLPSDTDSRQYPRAFIVLGGNVNVRQSDLSTVILTPEECALLPPVCCITHILAASTTASSVVVVY